MYGMAEIVGTPAKIWIAIMLIAGVVLPWTGFAGERVFGAGPVESQWQVESHAYLCRLEHPVPRFGRAIFTQPADGALRFELQSLRSHQPGEVALRAIPPEWRPGFPIVELGSVRLDSPRQALRIDDERAEWLLSELEEGLYPAAFYPAPAVDRDGISVVVSGVRFRDAFESFLECRARLLETDVTSLRAKTLRFDSGKSTLSSGDKQALTDLARFAKSTPSKKVLIEAHADARGSKEYNQRLSQRRARAVREFLLSQGLDRTRIRTSSYGESKPLASNTTEGGRTRNRRAAVRVVN